MPLTCHRELLLEIGDALLQGLGVLSLQREILARELDDLLRELLILAIEDLRRLTKNIDIVLVLEPAHAKGILISRTILSIHVVQFLIRIARDDPNASTAED